jgi:deoxyribodipyrimidine photolyase-related protein
MKTLRLILGDQLNIKHDWFKAVDENVLYCLFEMRQETDYVRHHIQKVIGFFAAMRTFANTLEQQGHQVVYYKINDKDNAQELIKNLNRLIEKHAISHFEYQYPDEYRLDEELKTFTQSIPISSSVYSTQHFYTDRHDLQAFFKNKKQYVMEYFYRDMRKKHGILVANNEPEGGQWNYDKTNRKKWKGQPLIPEFKSFKNNVEVIIKDISKSNIETIGHFNSVYFNYPISREQALEQLKFFCEHLLKYFGDFQDAMDNEEAYLFHSRLSFAINLKLISAKNVVDTVVNYYIKNESDIDISQVEGFIRQIIGWREYMRGMYWMLMPEVSQTNFLDNSNSLPEFFWNGETKMNCLKQTIKNSLDNAYAHHIQRLMITGNYALLTQTHPDEVDDWYLGIYADAVEWVQLPNTRGMSQFADGGKIATKPYVSSGSYIQKMSSYCDNCFYNYKKKDGEDACPFNSLYWNFLDEKRSYLISNNRMKMMYHILDKMDATELKNIKKRAHYIIANQNEI